MTGLRAWLDKLMGRSPKAEEPSPAPAKPTTAPSEGPLTEGQQAQRDKAGEPESGLPPEA
jgi:hypothetical protein